MSNLFNTLSIGYSGLRAAQSAIQTTAHNISNAENEGFTRQRVVLANATPLSASVGNIGNGVQVQDIKRVFDNFVFQRYTDISAQKEYSDFETRTLDVLSSYFPEINGVGIKADLAEFYNMWQIFAANPNNDAIKIALAKQTQTLTNSISSTQERIKNLQLEVNKQIEVNINQVNELASQLANLNISIDVAESGGGFSANDLRDRRNVIEKDLARLIGSDVIENQITANINVDSNANTRTGSYTLSVNGHNLVDGNTFHPLKITNEKNPSGFYEVSYVTLNGTVVRMEEVISGGKIGAMFDLRGGTINTTSGMPTDGIIQNAISQFDAFAKGLIEATNNLYAQNATSRVSSNVLNLSPTSTLTNSSLNVKEGSFDFVVYDIDGNEIARRKIDINAGTTMNGAAGSNSIEGQILASVDDNNDGNANNNIDDFIIFNYQPNAMGELRLELLINPANAARGYTFSLQDRLESSAFNSGTNFAGALGLGRYFDGNSASNISLHNVFSDNPTKISAGHSSVVGDSRVAVDMLQQQFESYNFKVGGNSFSTTMSGMFDLIATHVGVATNSAISRNETISTQFNAIQMEYHSVSKVSLDEEMANLIRFQTSYGAAAKVITTVDQMMQTLLGIKQ